MMFYFAYPTRVFGAKGVVPTHLPLAKPNGLTTALVWTLVILAAGPAWAQTVYTWNGAVSSDFTDPANWSGGTVPPTNNAPTLINARITVHNGSNFPLLYTSAQGHTLYAASGGATSNRSLFIASGTNGSMEIQGGTFESQAGAPDGMANGATGSLTINGGSYINVNGSGAKTFLVVFGGNGTGTLTIQSGTFAVHTLKFGDSGTSTGTGSIYLNGGLLSVGTIVDSGSALSYLYLNGGTLQARATTTTFLNNLDNAYVSTGGAIIDTQSYSVTIPVVLKHDPALGSTPDGGLTKKGSGTLILSAANTYTGPTFVDAGVLRIENASALGTTDAGTTVKEGMQLALAGGITVTGESLTLYGQGSGNVHGLFAAGGGTNTWDGPITLAATNARIGAGSGQTLVVSGPISDGGSGYNLVIRNTGGETILKGANTYTGPTRVFVGTLKIDGGDNRLPVGSVLQIGNTSNVDWATFDLNGYNQQVAGLASEGSTMTMTVTNSSATASTLTIQNTADYTYSGLITGNLSLVKQGAAMQTLSGSSANTYTGTTTVQEGRLHLSKSSGVNAIGGNLVISGGAVTFGNSDQLPDTAAVTITAGVFNGTGPRSDRHDSHTETIASLTMTGGLYQSGTNSNWTITSSASFTGGSGNTIFIGNSGAVLDFGALTLTNMTATAGGNLATPNSFTLYGNSTSRQSTITVGSGGLTLDNAVINLRRGGAGALGSRLVLDGNVTTTGTSASTIKEDTAGGTTGSIAVELSSTSGTVTRTFNIGGGADLTISIPVTNGAADTAGITKTGPGTLTLSGANTYTGHTTVSAGVLRISNGAALGAGDGTTTTGTTVQSGARLELAGGISVSNEYLQLAGIGGGQGVLRNASGNNTWAGPVSLAADSRIDIVSGTTLTISGNVSLGSYGLTVRGGGNATISGQLSGSGGITLTDGGVLTLANANNSTSFSGKIGASYGVVSVADLNALGSHNQLRLGQGTYSVDTGTLRYTGITDATLTKEIRLYSDATYGKARLEVTTAGVTVTFTGNFQYESGATTGGQWILAGTGNGVITGNITTADASLRKEGSGTWTLTGSNTYKGITTVAAGSLRISSPTALGTTDGGTTVSSGARLELAGGITVSGEALSIAGDGGNFFGALQSASGTNTWDGPISLTANDSRLGANGAGQVLRVTGPIDDGPNTFNLIIRNADGGGETILSGQNTYGGATRVYVGVLKIDGGNDRLPTGSPLQIGNSANVAWARFDLNGWNQEVAGLVSEGSTMTMTVTNSSATAATLSINNSTDQTYSGVITGNLSLVKQGTGTQTLSGANTYTGTTDVQGGTLALVRSGSNNNISGSSAIRVAAGATLDVTGLAGSLLRLASGQTLQGNGTVQGSVEAPAGSFLGAGMSPGHLTISSNYTQAGTLVVELAGYTQGGTQAVAGQWQTNGYDWVSVGGQAVLDGYLDIRLLANFQPQSGDVFNVLTAAGGITDQGLELLWQAGSLLPAQYWTYQIISGQGSEQILQLQLGVPEPASLVLLVIGVASLALPSCLRRRKKS